MTPIYRNERTFNFMLHGMGVSGVVFIIFILLLVRSDVHVKLEATESAQSEAQALLQRSQQIQADHHTSLQKLEQAKSKSLRIKSLVPATAGEIDFMAKLSKLAESTKFRIRDFRPGSVATDIFHKEMEIRFVGEGDYPAFCRFQSGLGELPLSYRIANLVVVAPRNGTQDFSADFQLRLVYDLSPNLTVAKKKL